jgi:hypothetical protein
MISSMVVDLHQEPTGCFSIAESSSLQSKATLSLPVSSQLPLILIRYVLMILPSYRVNIFGFPNSPAIKTKNLGLLDQRLAVEWLRDNTRFFGGDPNKMTLAGRSAGSQSIAYWSYAYINDPVVRSLIEFSGQPGLITNDDGSSWNAIANITGRVYN